MGRDAPLILGIVLLLGAGCGGGGPGAGGGAQRDGETGPGDEKRAEIAHFWEVFRAAEKAVRERRHAAAVPLLEEALAIRPGHESSLNHLTTCHIELGDPQAAIAALERIIEGDPMSSRAHARLGALHSTPGPGAPLDLQAAARHYDRLLELNPADSAPYSHLGRLALYRGDRENASRNLRRSIMVNPRGHEAGRHLARVLLLEGKPREAAALLVSFIDKELERRSPEGMTAEGDTEEEIRARGSIAPKILPLLDDLRRIGPGEGEPSELIAAAARRLESRWPPWRPSGVEDAPPRVAGPNGAVDGATAEGGAGASATSWSGLRIVKRRRAPPEVESAGAVELPDLFEEGPLLLADLDGDGVPELIDARPVLFREALGRRLATPGGESGTPLPTLRIHRREKNRYRDATRRWLPDGDIDGVPIVSLAAADLDGDGRLDLFLGCGSGDPLTVHPDLVLLQGQEGRLLPHRLDLGPGRHRGTRRVAEGGAPGTLLLERSSAFPAADLEGDFRITFP